jgi:pSer/pThr/pTyr-binding forkhead associated (FHA) protein
LYVRELEREHALVRRSGDGFEIVSISGEVMLNGRVVTVAPVKPGDRIELGTVRVQLGVEP